MQTVLSWYLTNRQVTSVDRDGNKYCKCIKQQEFNCNNMKKENSFEKQKTPITLAIFHANRNHEKFRNFYSH